MLCVFYDAVVYSEYILILNFSSCFKVSHKREVVCLKEMFELKHSTVNQSMHILVSSSRIYQIFTIRFWGYVNTCITYKHINIPNAAK